LHLCTFTHWSQQRMTEPKSRSHLCLTLERKYLKYPSTHPSMHVCSLHLRGLTQWFVEPSQPKRRL
jgi:hypothetical protein